MKTENNLEAILKSFDPKKVEEEKRKGIISIQEKKLNYGKEENIQPNIPNQINKSNINGSNTNTNLRPQNLNSMNIHNNQSNFHNNSNSYNPNFMQTQNKNNKNNRTNIQNNMNCFKEGNNLDNSENNENRGNKNLQGSHDSELNDFCLLNNIDDILQDYVEDDQKYEKNRNADIPSERIDNLDRVENIRGNNRNNYRQTKILTGKDNISSDNLNINQKENFVKNKNYENNYHNYEKNNNNLYNNFQIQERQVTNLNKNLINNNRVNDNYGNDINFSNTTNSIYYNFSKNNQNSTSSIYNKSHENTDETNQLSSIVEELKFDPEDLKNLIEENKFYEENNYEFNNNYVGNHYNETNNNCDYNRNNRDLKQVNHKNQISDDESFNYNSRSYSNNNLLNMNKQADVGINKQQFNNNRENFNPSNIKNQKGNSSINNYLNQEDNFNSHSVNNNKNNDAQYKNGNFIEKYCSNHQLANLEEWQGEFQWNRMIENANLKIFGFKTFRPNQREIINASLADRDIFVCMPTGGGKSLTFQIPALVSAGVTIVVMPLISLIMDQVSFMNGLGVRVIFLNKEGEEDLYRNFEELFDSPELEERCKLIFLTPEKISQSMKTMSLLRNLYNSNKIDRFVIDEAHCLSQWGREFRPDYLNLRVLRREFPRVPLLAITATAPNKIREDIITQLQMRDALFFRSSYNRTNLYIEIRNKKDMTDVVSNMANFIKKKYPDSSGLVYCASRKECETIAEKLRRDHGLSASYYHASMPEKQKNSVQEKWKNDEIRIIVATIAFGMGINKADVRFVIHHAMPKSFENYYQEIGRAGRDGNKSHCIMYYNPADRRTLEFLMSKQPNLGARITTQNLRKITEIIDYCEEYCECRRVIALLYFDEKFDRTDCKKMCDNCRKNLQKDERDVTNESTIILKFLNNCHKSNIDMTLNQSIDYLKGSKRDKNKNKKYPSGEDLFGALKGQNQENLKKIIRRLIILKYIDEKLMSIGENTFVTISISNEGIEFLKPMRNQKHIIITFPKISSGNNFEVDLSKNEIKSGIKSKKFISKNADKDNNDNDHNILDDVNLNDLEAVKNGKERKYARTKNLEKENREENDKNNIEKTCQKQKKNKNLNQEEDYGFCTQEQFEELLEKLKIKRREILKDENKKIEAEHSGHLPELNNNIENKIKKLSAEEIFPLTGLKELCRKLPSTEKELNSNNIFGVGAKYLSKYGKEFLPEIIKHLSLYEISKAENHFEEVVNRTIGFSGQKNNSFDKDDVMDNNNLLGNINLNKNNLNNIPTNTSTNLNPILHTNHKNNVIGVMRKSNLKDSHDMDESFNNSNFSLKNVNVNLNASFEKNVDLRKSELKIYNDNQIYSFNNNIPNTNLNSSSYLNNSNNKNLRDLDSYAMFNSMTDSKNKDKNRTEILVDLNKNLIKANDQYALDSFLKDVERYSDEVKKLDKQRDDMKLKPKDSGDSRDMNIIRPFGNHNNFPEKYDHINNIHNNSYEEFNAFDINNYNECNEENPNINGNQSEEEKEDEEFVSVSRQVKDMNSEMNKVKDTKKRKRKDYEDEDDDEFEAGGKKPKNSKAEYFKKRAMYAKINKYKQNKKNNFL